MHPEIVERGAEGDWSDGTLAPRMWDKSLLLLRSWTIYRIGEGAKINVTCNGFCGLHRLVSVGK